MMSAYRLGIALCYCVALYFKRIFYSGRISEYYKCSYVTTYNQ